MTKPKGGKRIRRGKKDNDTTKRSLEFKNEEQEYAFVNNNLGNCRLQVDLASGGTYLAIIPGKLRKKVWINRGDVLLVGVREFQQDKVDVLHRYNPDEVRTLISYGEISPKWGEGAEDEEAVGVEDKLQFGDGDLSEDSDDPFQKDTNPKDEEEEKEEKDIETLLKDL